MITEETKTLSTILRHRDLVRRNMQLLVQEFERRALDHDMSKLRHDELEGFVGIQRVAREHPIGTPEYEAVMRSNEVIDLHFSRNTHHPEHHPRVEDMGWLDVIEMVLDWKAASEAYGTNSLRDSLDYHRERHGFTDSQWWLVMQVVDWIENHDQEVA